MMKSWFFEDETDSENYPLRLNHLFEDPKKSNLTAFHHVSNTTGTRKWTFQDLSQDSQIMASALLRFDSLDKFTNFVTKYCPAHYIFWYLCFLFFGYLG